MAQLDEIPAIPCPCGTTRRAYLDGASGIASVHEVDVQQGAVAHHHRRQTEIYVVLDGEGFVELDGQKVPARPGTVVLIRPGCEHRAIGPLRLINVVIPAFDPNDEWLGGEIAIKGAKNGELSDAECSDQGVGEGPA